MRQHSGVEAQRLDFDSRPVSGRGLPPVRKRTAAVSEMLSQKTAKSELVRVIDDRIGDVFEIPAKVMPRATEVPVFGRAK